ncbi:hypothetical protein FNF27_04870 [Cafeteria roenbergensis]|uniref:3-oxo-5-alpha-steroid 4-dehydrogenase C-terminal domain-containing protein n=1 Tax=Cafeteria roenbergensis TaxID=33653 RepID=A0A5A8ECU2_CAFRO|nr:hypothetical protein FNF27_04870 [Cafeteria roenbergensis]|mmetsp:Transcript_16083/g.60862  ORF Transcript_16083/g.60862 Transcript_16083/m.60862 type:complete len:325 (-) Transcript_16083:124-1098(-)
MDSALRALQSYTGIVMPHDLTLAEGAALFLFAAGAAGGIFAAEPTPYSKFSSKAAPKPLKGEASAKDELSSKGWQVPSRAGMAIIYALGTAAGAYAVASMAVEADSAGAGTFAGLRVPSLAGIGAVVSAAVTGRSAAAMGGLAAFAHFAKRELEITFVHSYSGSMPAQSALFISAVYGVVGWGLHHFAARVGTGAGLDASDAAGPGSVRRAVGGALFVGGMAVNAIHHVMLAKLREAAASKDGAKKYVIPRGGLFELVACPHYFGECLQWAGLAIALPTPLHVLWAAQSLSYLSGRAAHTTQWYRERFGGAYPSSRRHIIPFLY